MSASVLLTNICLKADKRQYICTFEEVKNPANEEVYNFAFP